MLKSVREQTKHMVETRLAAECDYAENYRRDTAVRFVVDAFNGRVDALLTEAEHENYGTIEQQIRDVFSIVNKNGEAFRNARILPTYLDARLAELKWAVLAFALRERDREEQRRIKEQMREEEKVRRDYERALRETEEEETRIKKALEYTRQEVEHATTQERAKFEAQLVALTEQLKVAEEMNQRALSMAQQTKKGNVYIISNIGSFGEEVIKIGMTRRLEPMDRIWELSDASVPFDFDVHALIPCDDAPALEFLLHTAFEDQRINKVNMRKEFFKTSLERIRAIIANRGIEAEFTMHANAHEYRETLKQESIARP
jgi:cell division septum initiation protein DivIVA